MSTTRHTYYTKMRPPGPGCQPSDGLQEVKDYGTRKRVADGISVWGEVNYNRQLTDNEIADYELVPAQ